jgi:SsrA-binding protein
MTDLKSTDNQIATNRKARYEYSFEEYFEAGIVLQGWEVKSLRAGKLQLADSYVMIKRGEAWWIGSQVSPLLSASTHVSPEPTRSRKLLLNRKELDKLVGLTQRQGYTLIPLSAHWSRGRAKLNIGLAKGKKQHDKRATIRERDWQREKGRIQKLTR